MFVTQRLVVPPRLLENTILLPSGEIDGRSSSAALFVRFVAPDPSALTRQISEVGAPDANTMGPLAPGNVRPSAGDARASTPMRRPMTASTGTRRGHELRAVATPPLSRTGVHSCSRVQVGPRLPETTSP
jgi:hypothetical protein